MCKGKFERQMHGKYSFFQHDEWQSQMLVEKKLLQSFSGVISFGPHLSSITYLVYVLNFCSFNSKYQGCLNCKYIFVYLKCKVWIWKLVWIFLTHVEFCIYHLCLSLLWWPVDDLRTVPSWKLNKFAFAICLTVNNKNIRNTDLNDCTDARWDGKLGKSIFLKKTKRIPNQDVMEN